jgi:hypothetical protein
VTDEEFEASEARVLAHFEAESTRLYGPPELRARKNQRYVERLVRKHSEPVIRGLLMALSRLEEPQCAHWLSEVDLASKPLTEIIDPFEFGGLRFAVRARDTSNYEVEIAMSFGNCGDGGRFLVVRDADTFVVKEALRSWIN